MLRRTKLILTPLFAIAMTFGFVSAQSTSPKNSVVTGDVVSVDASRVVLKTASGDVTVTLSAATQYKKIAPEDPSIASATPAAFSDVEVGDKLLVTGIMAADKTLPAKAVYLMTKAALSERAAKDRERWSVKGVSGRITAIDAMTRKITISVSGLNAASSVVITPKPNAKFKRYAPNSVKYSDAVASDLGSLGVGDMLRAAGDRSEDGTAFSADEILSGSFQTIAGTVKTVDAAKNEIVLTDLQTKKDIVVALNSATLLKRFPEQFAQMLAARQMGSEGADAGERGAPAGARPAGGPPQREPGARPRGQEGGERGAGRGGMMGRGSVDEMLDRFPDITATDLKPGEMVAFSSSRSGATDRISAIKLLAGVEPFVRVAQMAASRGGANGSAGQSLSIPGLDGGGFDGP